MLTAGSLEPASDSVSPSLSLSFSRINKHLGSSVCLWWQSLFRSFAHFVPGLLNSFIYFFLREREHAQAEEGQRERGDIESEAGSRLRAVSTEPDAGLELLNRETMT